LYFTGVSEGGLQWSGLLAEPKLPLWWVVVFIVATLFLNSFLLITSEAHWLRVWAMRTQVQKTTRSSMVWTAAVWCLLIAMGLLSVGITSHPSLDGAIDVVNHLSQFSPFFGVLFWIAAAAAIFSTADSQIYSLLVISAFDTKTGQSSNTPRYIQNPLFASLTVAAVFTLAMLMLDESGINFEVVVFFVFPIFLCLVPAVVEYILRGICSLWPILTSIGLYAACGLGMIIFPSFSFPLSLSAPLMPALVSALLWITLRNSPRPPLTD
jgi:hypothetical protein